MHWFGTICRTAIKIDKGHVQDIQKKNKSSTFVSLGLKKAQTTSSGNKKGLLSREKETHNSISQMKR